MWCLTCIYAFYVEHIWWIHKAVCTLYCVWVSARVFEQLYIRRAMETKHNSFNWLCEICEGCWENHFFFSREQHENCYIVSRIYVRQSGLRKEFQPEYLVIMEWCIYTALMLAYIIRVQQGKKKQIFLVKIFINFF